MHATARLQARNAKRAATDIPKFFRPKLSAQRQLDAKVVHWDLIARFTSGQATDDDMWDWVSTGLTYSHMLQLLQADGMEFTQEAQEALAEHLLTFASVTNRRMRTGRAGFSGEELLIARAAAGIMDQLIELDRHGIAKQAALWSNAQMDRLRASTNEQTAVGRPVGYFHFSPDCMHVSQSEGLQEDAEPTDGELERLRITMDMEAP